MGIPSYPDEERTIHHRQSRASPTAKFLRYTFQTMLFFMCLAVVGGIVMGIIALHSTATVNVPDDKDAQARNLFARSYYGNITASGNVIPTGTAPVSMNNATVVVNTTTGSIPSVPPPSITVTVNGTGAAEASAGTGQVANITAAAVPSPSGGSGTPVFISAPPSACAPATTVILTVTQTGGDASPAQMTSTPKAVAPITTLIIPDLYGDQSALSSQALNSTIEAPAIQEATETAASGSNLTTTVTVFEQPTVIITSTKFVEEGMSSSPALPTGQRDVDNSTCISENFTAPATPSTVGALNNTALETVTVQPANPASPEATETASSNGTSPVIVSEGTLLKQGNRSGSIISGCVVVLVATMLFML